MYIVRHLCNFTVKLFSVNREKLTKKTDETMTKVTYHLQHT